MGKAMTAYDGIQTGRIAKDRRGKGWAEKGEIAKDRKRNG